MVKRIALVAAVAALTTPAAALAGDGGKKSTGDLVSKIAQARHALEEKFGTFADKCLVATAPAGCADAAHKFVTKLDALEAKVAGLESRIAEKCSGPNPPKQCAQTNGVLVQLDKLAEAAESYEAQIKAAYPGA